MVDEKIIAEATAKIVSRFKPNKIILFGSHARGITDENSDIDLLVITQLHNGRHALMLEMIKTLRNLPAPKDIVVITPEEFERDRHIPGTVALCADQEGKILYERSEK